MDDKDATLREVERSFAEASIDRLDGLTIDLGDRWFNLRPSNTEPVLRLNAEAPTDDEVASIVGSVAQFMEESQ